MPNTLKTSLLLKTRQVTIGSSSTMSQLETSSAVGNNFCLPTFTDSFPCTQQLSCQMESNMGINEDRRAEERNYVTDSTTRDVKRQIVDTVTPVRHAEAQPTESPTATLPLGIEVTGR